MAELVDEVPALRALSPTHRATIAGCGRNRVFAVGEVLLREGGPADEFFAVREGAVAIETEMPGRGAVTIQTVHPGELIGWSWLMPPYRAAFSARSLTVAHVIAFDGACLRGKCDADPALGFDLMRLVVRTLADRLSDTRLRLLDVYAAHA
jgi:CRP-like cAMP-binding protein